MVVQLGELDFDGFFHALHLLDCIAFSPVSLNFVDAVSEVINLHLEHPLLALHAHCPKGKYPEEWDWDDIHAYFERVFAIKMKRLSVSEIEGLDIDDFKQRVEALVDEAYAAKEKEMEEAGFNMRAIERMVLLRVVDSKWMDHIDAMDQFRRGIGLRAIAHRDPINEYRMEGFDMFDAMVESIREEAVYMLYHIKVQSKVEQKEVKDTSANIDADGNPIATEGPKTRRAMQTNQNAGEKPAPVRAEKKVGRNEPCPCGSGKKYKNCCGKNE